MSFLRTSYNRIQDAVSQDSLALPDPSTISSPTSELYSRLPTRGLGDESTLKHLLDDVIPFLGRSKTSANYYGFVTGGVLPIAEVADNVVTAFDQNVAVHLPSQSISTVVEDHAFRLLLELLALSSEEWTGRTFTTGATAANILGLACGREAILRTDGKESAAECGIMAAYRRKGIDGIQVLTAAGHSSLYKAASMVGIGSGNVIDCGIVAEPWRFDLTLMETLLKKERMASIVVVSCGEVNTGRFEAQTSEMETIRSLCDQYNAWLHVDAGKSKYPLLFYAISVSIRSSRNVIAL